MIQIKKQKHKSFQRPFTPRQKNCEEISMHFVFILPKIQNGYTSLMIVVDKLSKRARFILLEMNNIAENIARSLYEEVCKHSWSTKTNNI